MHNCLTIKKGIEQGNFLALAKAISFIENKEPGYDAFLESLQTRPIPIIGVTGPPGAGKSTLISGMIENWVRIGKKVAVLSVDPSSPFHKGAILGDRIRMKDWYTNPNVFIRSLATRGHLGGMMSGMIELTTLLQTVGFDIIMIETVGVGQSEVEIAGLADTCLVVLVPEAGDEVQMMKSGLMEIANIFVVNKSDRPDAASYANHLLQTLLEASEDQRRVPVLKTIATTNVGIPELIQVIMEHQTNPVSLTRKKQLWMTKLFQIIAAHKMNQLNALEMEADLGIAIQQPHFNIFKFSKQFL